MKEAKVKEDRDELFAADVTIVACGHVTRQITRGLTKHQMKYSFSGGITSRHSYVSPSMPTLSAAQGCINLGGVIKRGFLRQGLLTVAVRIIHIPPP